MDIEKLPFLAPPPPPLPTKQQGPLPSQKKNPSYMYATGCSEKLAVYMYMPSLPWYIQDMHCNTKARGYTIIMY